MMASALQVTILETELQLVKRERDEALLSLKQQLADNIRLQEEIERLKRILDGVLVGEEALA